MPMMTGAGLPLIGREISDHNDLGYPAEIRWEYQISMGSASSDI